MNFKFSLRHLLFISAVLLLIFVFWKFPVKDMLIWIIAWIHAQGTIGFLVYILVYTIAAVLLFPGSILTLSAGFAWGVVVGSIVVSIASIIAATAAFIVGRYFARDWVYKKVSQNPGFKRIDRAVARQGFKIVFLTRLSPVFPFTLQNYAYGVTGVSLRDYFIASWAGMLPGTVMYVYLGSLITEIAQLTSGSTADIAAKKILYFVGLAVTIIVTVFITRIARKALKESEET